MFNKKIDGYIEHLIKKNMPEFNSPEEMEKCCAEYASKKKRRDIKVITLMIAAAFMILYVLMAVQPNPDDVRKDGILHEGIIVNEGVLVETYSNPSGGHRSDEMPVINLKLEDGSIINVYVSWELMEDLHTGQKLKVWEYKGYFLVDEKDTLEYQNPYPFLSISIFFVVLSLFLSRGNFTRKTI